MNFDELKRQYPGYQGWGETEAFADFRATGGSGKRPSQPSASNFQMPDIEGILRRQEEARLGREAEARGAETEFMERFKTEFPAALTGLETELGLPGLRQTAQTAGQTLRGVQDVVRSVPTTQQTIAKQVGISAPRLQQRISAESAKLSPTLEAATRGFTEATSATQFGEAEFCRRAERALAPLTTKLGLLKDRFSREATGFGQAAERELSSILSKISTGIQISIAEMNKAMQLAQLEQNKYEFESKVSTVDLGNRIALLDRSGKEIGSMPKGTAPTSGTKNPPLPIPPPGQKTSTTGAKSGISNLWSLSNISNIPKQNFYSSFYGGSDINSALNALK